METDESSEPTDEKRNLPVDIDSTSHLPKENQRGNRVINLAITLLKELPQGLPPDISDPSWDEAFEGAIKRAEFLLRRAEKNDPLVHAYELFKEGEVYSAQQVADKFRNSGWGELTSKNTVEKLFNHLHSQISEFGSHLVENVIDKTQKAVEVIVVNSDPLSGEMIISKTFPAYSPQLNHLMRSVLSRFHGPNGEQVDNREFYTKFLEWCFVSEKRGEQKVRKYRAHEIFRFAATQKWDEETLRKRTSDLDHEFVPEAPEVGELFTIFKQNMRANRVYS